MANKYTASTYERISKDEDYTKKAIDSFVKMEHGQNATVEFTDNGKVIINGSSILDYATMVSKAIDRQSELTERPELEKVYKDRQTRVEQAERFSKPNLVEKSADEIMAEQAYAQMRSNASNRVLASQKPQSKSLGLPSER